jgi:hypothetical protein
MGQQAPVARMIVPLRARKIYFPYVIGTTVENQSIPSN